MKKNSTALLLVFLLFFARICLSQIQSISGQLINGRGTTEKLDFVNLKFYLNSELIGEVYSDDSGFFNLNLISRVENDIIPGKTYNLNQNYPNPFNPNTTISYTLDRGGTVKLEIYNIIGQKVRTLLHSFQSMGTHFVIWDGKNDQGSFCGNGSYFYRFQFDGQTEIRKMCFLNVPTVYNYQATNLSGLKKVQTSNQLEIQLSNRDIQDTTFVYMFEQLPEHIELAEMRVHVFPFSRTIPDTLSLMSGESASDTLDIYFEKPIEISSPHLPVEWCFTEDSLVAITYLQVDRHYAWVEIKEIGGVKSSFAAAYFNLSPRLKLDKAKLRKGYIGIPYQEIIGAKNQVGDYQISYEYGLPAELAITDLAISGTPLTTFEDYLHFNLIDERDILVADSTILIIREPYNIDFGEYTVDMLSTYPRDGTHPYRWISGYTGVTRDLFYKGQRIANANPDGSQSCYCCGLTFEVFFRAIQQLNSDLASIEDVNGMTYNDMKYFIQLWFVQSVWGDGPGIAMNYFGIGDNVGNWDDVQTGDFVQLWRTTGSGHSVIFINWTTNAAGDRTGFKYWSTQGSTNGINYNTEYFSGMGGNVNPDYVYFCRLRSPENFVPFNRQLLPDYEEIVNNSEQISPKYFMNNEHN